MQVVILAGGLGTRMAAVSGTKPKALLEINGRPFLDYQVRWLERAGSTRLTFSIGHRGEQILKFLKSFTSAIPIEAVLEPEPHGTGGALRFLYDAGALDPQFLLLYGDSYLNVDLRAVWQTFLASDRSALMTVFRNHGQFDRSNARYHGGRVTFYSKTSDDGAPLDYIDYGLSAFKASAVADFFKPGVKVDLADYMTALSRAGDLEGFEVKERFYEVGSPAGLAEFERYARTHLTPNAGRC